MPPSSDPSLVLTDADTAAIQAFLAEQIGPAARIVLVRTLPKWDSAGKSTSNAYLELLNLLATFIDSEEKRSQFIESALTIPLGE